MVESVERCLEVLTGTPRVIRALVLDRSGHALGEHWTMRRYGLTPEGEPTFSPFDVVGHLIHGERTDWIPRARLILSHEGDAPAPPFEPFDRTAHVEASKGKRMEELVEEFDRLRAANVDALRAMDLREQDLARRGTHPALGGVTLGQLLATWTVHDLHHVAQIAKGMARQLTDDVGPWRAYLGILG
jgi:hypothetical protein